jgi:hypothetical protein
VIFYAFIHVKITSNAGAVRGKQEGKHDDRICSARRDQWQRGVRTDGMVSAAPHGYSAGRAGSVGTCGTYRSSGFVVV